jgi:hypothetical protein
VHCTAPINYPKCQASHQLVLREVLSWMSLSPSFLVAVTQLTEKETFASRRTARFTSGEPLNSKNCGRAKHVLHCWVYPHARWARGRDFQKWVIFVGIPTGK